MFDKFLCFNQKSKMKFNGNGIFQACEALETIDRLSDVRYRQLVDNYLNRDAPAIITDAMDSWTAMNTDFFWFENITHVSIIKKINTYKFLLIFFY